MRLSLFTPEDELLRHFHLEDTGRTYRKRYNIVPGQSVLVLLEREGAYRLAELTWGLIPADAHHPAVGAGLFQVRQESLLELESMRQRLEKRRCAVLCNGIFLWQKSNQGSQPWYVYLRGSPPFALAALWEMWGPRGEEPIYSCTIITSEPNDLVAPIHHRMPVILAEESLAQWLNQHNTNPEQLQDLCLPYPATDLELHKVSPLVDNEDNDTIEVTDPIL